MNSTHLKVLWKINYIFGFIAMFACAITMIIYLAKGNWLIGLYILGSLVILIISLELERLFYEAWIYSAEQCETYEKRCASYYRVIKEHESRIKNLEIKCGIVQDAGLEAERAADIASLQNDCDKIPSLSDVASKTPKGKE